MGGEWYSSVHCSHKINLEYINTGLEYWTHFKQVFPAYVASPTAPISPPPFHLCCAVFSLSFLWGVLYPPILLMVRPHPLYPFISWKYHLEMPLLSSYLPLSDTYHNCTYQLNSCTIVDCILGLNLVRYAHASYTNNTVIHDDVIMNDVISNSMLSAPPY